MAMTERGVFHNLDESEYAITNNVVVFFFSSKFYRRKFLDEYPLYRIEFRRRLQKQMYLEDMNTDFLADIHLYREIEKRGFRVVKCDNGSEYKWRNILQYALENRTGLNGIDWQKTPVQKLKEIGKTTEKTRQAK